MATGRRADDGVASVVLNDEPDNDAVVHLATMKAACGMPLSGKSIGASTVGSAAIPMFTSKLSQQERDVVPEFARQHAGVQLAVVGQADADKIGTLAVPNCHPIVDVTNPAG